MKNTSKMFGIIAVVAIICLSMTACPTDPDPEPQKSITVTNIREGYFGGNACGVLILMDGNREVAQSNEIPIPSALATFPLFELTGENPWTGTGDYTFSISIFEMVSTEEGEGERFQDIYTGKTTVPTTISSADTPIAFTQFTKISP